MCEASPGSGTAPDEPDGLGVARSSPSGDGEPALDGAAQRVCGAGPVAVNAARIVTAAMSAAPATATRARREMTTNRG